MGFFLSKLVPTFVYPLGAALVLVLVAILVSRRRALSVAILLLVVAALWGASMPLTAQRLMATLETRFPPEPVAEAATADAIIVLGGGLDAPPGPRLRPELGGSGDRALHAARLYRADKAPLVIATGGMRPSAASELTEAELIARLLVEWGVPRQAIVLETGSRNTHENAQRTARLMSERGLQTAHLVTSARHMPRALAVFRSAGVQALPAPTDYAGNQAEPVALLTVLPSAAALAQTTLVVKEYIGTAYYRWRGWIDSGAAGEALAAR